MFKGGTFSPALKQLLSERARISDALDQALDNWKFHLSKNKKIKTVAVISAPGIETCLQVGFEDGKSFRLPLDGPALFNLNNEVAAALSKHLHRPYGGKG
ncbi:MAG: hypothetical protein COB49_00590 [Alphaproteobacteria bacterium]|nr:MAG: hypothetical protein COB49_00590 [Alphaproteobacteria bacterium]